MTFSIEQVDLWRGCASETQTLEFKEAGNQYDTRKLCRYCVAIANEGGGHLVLGIADKPPRAVVGSQAFPDTRSFREMNGSDRVRACFQYCVLQYVLRKQMTNQSLRERFGLPEGSSNTISQIITATIEQGLGKSDPNAPDSRRYARYIPAWV